jgi:hypothetical protein
VKPGAAAVTDLATFAIFKPTAGGYVYRAPNTWLVGASDHYLVEESQKAQITSAISGASRVVLWTTTILWLGLSCVLVAASVIGAYRSGYHQPALAGMLTVITMLLSFVIALLVSRQLLRRRLRPILANLPTTDERITKAEARDAIRKAQAATPISPMRRRVVKIASVVAGGAMFFSLFARAMDLQERHPDWSLTHSLYVANVSFVGLTNAVAIVAFAYLFWTFGRKPSRS